MPNYSTATELPLYLCSEDDSPKREALAASCRGQWLCPAVHPQTVLPGEKELCEKELAKLCQVLPALLLGPWPFSYAIAVPGPNHGACCSRYDPDLLFWLLSLTVDLPHNYGSVCRSPGLEGHPGYLHRTCFALRIRAAGEGFNSGGWAHRWHWVYLQHNGNTWH